nr:polysaccharide biosynthesis C-terminal domain-containing protein [Quadrisphaera sp. RL12-1S]
MQVLLVASLPAGLASVCGAGLNALDRPGTLSAVQAGVAVLNVALTFALVPSMGGMGAAVATLVAFAVLTGVTLGLYCRLSHHRVGELLVPRADDARALVALLRRAPA